MRVDVEGVKEIALLKLKLSSSMMQDGILTNVTGKVKVHAEGAPDPGITRPRHWFPVDVGLVPQVESVGIVPVAFQ